MTDNQQLQEIILKKMLGQGLTGAEETALASWLRDPANKSWYDTELESGHAFKVANEVLDWNESRLDEKMRAALTPKPQTNPIRRMRPWLAAASVLLFFLVGAWLWREFRHGGGNGVRTGAMAQILPATNKARLKLANGSVLLLDSTRNGRIAMQGRVSITKADGKLAYISSGRSSIPEVGLNELMVPRGGQFELQLPDGTHVWLNSATDITYPVTFGAERRVKINGEAYFDVAKDESKPFIVETAQGATQVLGTSFNVNAYVEDSTEMITLISGAVRVTLADKSLTLQPGDQALEKDRDVSLVHPNLQAVTAWRRGFFYFQNADIRTIMRQFSRFYDVTVRYEGRPSAETYDGLISRDLNLSEALALLSKMNIRATLDGKTITVSPEGSQN